MSKQTKRQQAWTDLVKLIVRPPKRYKHQRDGNLEARVKQLRKRS